MAKKFNVVGTVTMQNIEAASREEAEKMFLSEVTKHSPHLLVGYRFATCAECRKMPCECKPPEEKKADGKS